MMDLDRMIIIPSKSRYELTVAAVGEAEARKRFEAKEGLEKVVVSHYAQKENIGKMIHHLGVKSLLADRSMLTPELIAEKDLFVFLGGDNHFTYCAQDILRYLHVHPQASKKVVGVVLDPDKSFGGLLYFDVDMFLDYVPELEKEEFRVESWTTLEASMNGLELWPAVSEYFIGEYANASMSRGEVFIDGKRVGPDKSSGILIATGAGTGRGSWYNNVHQCMSCQEDALEKDAERANLIFREHWSRTKASFERGQHVQVYSFSDADGRSSPDSHTDRDTKVPFGSVIDIRISDVKLDVVKPEYNK